MKNNVQSLVWPKPLCIGDKAAITAPASPVSDEILDTAVKSIKSLELEPVLTPSCWSHRGYLAGTDRQRADDFNHVFASDDIMAVFCLRGGYGSMRILPLIDFNIIKAHPKIMIGCSDITALHTAINNYCGFITFHGPMPSIGYNLLDDYSLNSMKHILFHEKSPYSLENPVHEHIEILQPGNAEGILTGGNLSLLVSTLGSPYEINTNGKILFIEETGESIYRLDRLLTALSLSGKFRDCEGIIFGTFTECSRSESKTAAAEPTIENDSPDITDVINEVVLPWGKPTFFNLRSGHIYPQCTLPLGAYVKINNDNKSSVNISVL